MPVLHIYENCFLKLKQKSLFLIFLLFFIYLFIFYTHIPFPGDAFSTEDLPTIPGIRV